MFKNAVIFRATGAIDPVALIGGTELAHFVECGPAQPKSSGFVPPRGKANPLVESIGGQLILAVRTQTKSVPAAEVKKRLDIALDQIEKETGRRPKGKRSREIKDEVIHTLLPKAFPKDSQITIWIDPQAGLVVIGTPSMARADEVATLLIECLPGVRLSPLATQLSPVTGMASWLLEKDAPGPFTLDRECELKQPDGEKAVVRYSRHTLDIDEVGEHIKQGKQPTRVAMTRAGRVSFVLTDSLALRKISMLDVTLEAATSDEKADAFDTNVVIETGELRPLIEDLTRALGGETEPQKPAQE